MAPTRVFAPAKINLTLHVTGQRPDGYHLLDSLVVFADVGDWITVSNGTGLTLTLDGPRARGVPSGPENLVLKAAALMGVQEAAIHLEKHLPAAAGIGGGSSDAAATMRACARHFDLAIPVGTQTLGADVPVCLTPQVMRMQGIGDVLTPLDDLPQLWVVLVNPGVDVATPVVFKDLVSKENSPMPDRIPAFETAQDCAAFLMTQRNDLEAPALAHAPEIAASLSALRASNDCLLARMSGSGATCFGLFSSPQAAAAAAKEIKARHAGWWVKDAAVLRA